MKKILLTFAICAFGIVNAQTEKGSWVIGGSTTIGFNNVSTKYKVEGQSSDGAKVSTFTFTPSVGYFVIDKLSVGLDLGYTTITTKYNEGNYNYKESLSTFSILPTATYYFKSDSKIMPYLGAGVGYGSTTSKEDNEENYKVDGLSWKAKGGIAYLITEKVAVDLGVSFNQFSNKESNYGYDIKTNVNTFGVAAGLSIFL
jgi:outer membrane protein